MKLLLKRKSIMLPGQPETGFSIIEVLIVAAVMIIIAGITLPQIISSRRLLRFNGLSREIASQLRFARQQAIAQGEVFRFRYDDRTKQIVIIDNEEKGTLANPLANNPANDIVVRTVSLAGGGIPENEIAYGLPGVGVPSNLPDGISGTALVNNRVEIVFQPDGSVLDGGGNPSSAALFLYNTGMPKATAFAISVIGSGGRVKVWRYNRDANLYVE